jgi:hypothetical protein
LADFICNPEFLRALNKPSVIVVFPHPELGADKMIPLGLLMRLQQGGLC